MAGREMLGVGTKGLDMVPGWLFLWEKKLRCKRKSTGGFHGKEASARSRVQPRLPFGFWACIPGFSLVGSVLQPTLPILGHRMSSFWAGRRFGQLQAFPADRPPCFTFLDSLSYCHPTFRPYIGSMLNSMSITAMYNIYHMQSSHTSERHLTLRRS